ncbi:MAG: hypothetical protein IIC75_00580 [Bacteroidetes bacterium]|nr:hypothetical protein [Bacteroidota bacterium]
MKSILAVILISLTLFQSTERIEAFTVENINPIKIFKEFIAKHIDSYKNDKRENVTLLGGGWVNLKYEPKKSYKLDAFKSDSLKNPYIGVCEFTLTRYYTAFHKNKKDAIWDKKFIKSSETVHRHHYTFKKNKWIINFREHKGYSSWYDCNQIIESGPLKGRSNIYGCWEK